MVFTIVLWGYSFENEVSGGGGFGVRVLEGVGVAEVGTGNEREPIPGDAFGAD